VFTYFWLGKKERAAAKAGATPREMERCTRTELDAGDANPDATFEDHGRWTENHGAMRLDAFLVSPATL
jgi:hypothetical protein